jgi:hypothetical protein
MAQRPHGTARSAADGVTMAVDQAITVAGKTGSGIAAFRGAVRRAPLAMSLVMLGLGYLIGTVRESSVATTRR